MPDMKILAIESSCDETAAAVLISFGTKISISSSVVASQIKLHAKTGGVVPEVAARAHIEHVLPVIKRALSEAGIALADIDAIAVTAGPGLITSLRVGVDTAQALAFALAIPLVAVNHIEAHLYSPFIHADAYALPAADSLFPAISLVVSGGHTDLSFIKNFLNHKKLGSTLDDAAGECFDKTAKLLGLPYPGGPALSKLAKLGKPVIPFPRPMLESGDFNFSFSGLKTAVLYFLRDHKLQAKDYKLRANIAASVQQAIIDVLVAKTVAAARKYKARTVLLGGGVAANHLLRDKLKAASAKLKARFLAAEAEYCTDNAAMIAFAGYLRIRGGDFTPRKNVRADAGWELK